jgi:hypothetical protein
VSGWGGDGGDMYTWTYTEEKKKERGRKGNHDRMK